LLFTIWIPLYLFYSAIGIIVYIVKFRGKLQ
jgi:hypothetical protein